MAPKSELVQHGDCFEFARQLSPQPSDVLEQKVWADYSDFYERFQCCTAHEHAVVEVYRVTKRCIGRSYAIFLHLGRIHLMSGPLWIWLSCGAHFVQFPHSSNHSWSSITNRRLVVPRENRGGPENASAPGYLVSFNGKLPPTEKG